MTIRSMFLWQSSRGSAAEAASVATPRHATWTAGAGSSDGIYVFMGRFATLLREGTGTYFPTVGDQLVLRGPVEEFFNLTQLNSPRVVAVERSPTHGGRQRVCR